jgi:hypothetical protein
MQPIDFLTIVFCVCVFFLHYMFRSTLLDGSMWLTSAAFNSHAPLFHFSGFCASSDDLKTSEHKRFGNWILYRPRVRGWDSLPSPEDGNRANGPVIKVGLALSKGPN